MEASTRLNGSDLRLIRLARDVRQSDLARAWGCTRQNVARVEGSRRLTTRAVAAYMAALASAELASAEAER